MGNKNEGGDGNKKPDEQLTAEQLAEQKRLADKAKQDEEEKLREEQAAENRRRMANVRAQRGQVHHVTGPGSIRLDGVLYKAGAELLLTEEEAADFGEAVTKGKSRPPRTSGRQRAGKYKLVGLGSIRMDGKLYKPGDVAEFSAEDATTFALQLEPVE